MDDLAHTLLYGYLAALACLAVFGAHRLLLLAVYLHGRSRAPEAPSVLEDSTTLPHVTVQLPVYNERFVVSRLIHAACALDYPRDRLEIQVLDDSDDETRGIAAALVERYRSRGFRITHQVRNSREGFKAGALAAGLLQAGGEFLAIFDADFLPTPDFLRRMLPSLLDDPGVGMVQARWGHLNREESLLTRAQAILLDGHFLIEHAARSHAGLFFNFNGTAGIWRRRCLEEAGGWEADTLTEDLDLSYRAQLRGWRFAFRHDVIAPAELPAEMEAFKSQQHRWAKGSLQTARKLAPALLGAPVGLRRKVEALFHLADNAAYLLLLLLAVLLVASLPARLGTDWPVPAVELPLFLLGTGSVCAFYLRSQHAAGGRGWRRWALLPLVMAVGISLSINNGRAVVEGLVGKRGVFHRTPKRGPAESGYRLPIDPLVLLEGALVLYFGAAILHAVRLEAWSALPFLAIYGGGFALISAYQTRAWLRRRRQRRLWARTREVI